MLRFGLSSTTDTIRVAVDREADGDEVRIAVGAHGRRAGQPMPTRTRRRISSIVHQPARHSEVEVCDVRRPGTRRRRRRSTSPTPSEEPLTRRRRRGAGDRTACRAAGDIASRVVRRCSTDARRTRRRRRAPSASSSSTHDRRPASCGDLPGVRAPSSGATRSYTASIACRERRSRANPVGSRTARACRRAPGRRAPSTAATRLHPVPRLRRDHERGTGRRTPARQSSNEVVSTVTSRPRQFRRAIVRHVGDRVRARVTVSAACRERDRRLAGATPHFEHTVAGREPGVGHHVVDQRRRDTSGRTRS